MSPNASKAMEELMALGATILEASEEAGYSEGTAFVLVWASDDGSQVFADIDGRRIKERFEGGRFINPKGFRQDVHEILARYDLLTDWVNDGQVAVYDDPDAPGFRHAAEAKTRMPPR